MAPRSLTLSRKSQIVLYATITCRSRRSREEAITEKRAAPSVLARLRANESSASARSGASGMLSARARHTRASPATQGRPHISSRTAAAASAQIWRKDGNATSYIRPENEILLDASERIGRFRGLLKIRAGELFLLVHQS